VTVSSFAIWPCVVRWVAIYVSEEHIASIFRVEEIISPPAYLLKLFLRPWRWRRYVPPERRLQLNRLHGIISQKMILFRTYWFKKITEMHWACSLAVTGIDVWVTGVGVVVGLWVDYIRIVYCKLENKWWTATGTCPQQNATSCLTSEQWSEKVTRAKCFCFFLLCRAEKRFCFLLDRCAPVLSLTIQKHVSACCSKSAFAKSSFAYLVCIRPYSLGNCYYCYTLANVYMFVLYLHVIVITG
jgi:hypothetical protein